MLVDLLSIILQDPPDASKNSVFKTLSKAGACCKIIWESTVNAPATP
jgi:hypothetical protein